MEKFDGYKKCEFCGGYDYPGTEYKTQFGYTRIDRSMVCNGVQTWDTDPFAEEIHGDSSLYFQCEGERYQSAMDI